jgi:hypothetical protein
MDQFDGHPSADRILGLEPPTWQRVLDVVPLGMWNRIGSDEIASRSGTSKSTVLRALKSMMDEPAVVRSADRWTPAGYRPGYYRIG